MNGGIKIEQGSQPIAPFIITLNIPAVSVHIPNPDNNTHAPNENLRPGNFLEGIHPALQFLPNQLIEYVIRITNSLVS
jgi:hypothetical protein